jgi:hypothetical protein
VALVEKPQKPACFTGATVGATNVNSGITADFCGIDAPQPSLEMFHGTLLEPSELLRDGCGVPEGVGPDPANNLPAELKAAFDERAAIVEADGGLDRAAAERLAWEEVNAGPVGDALEVWRAWMNCRIPLRMARGLSRVEAMRSVWAEAECIWHCRHSAPPDPDRCAGCGEWMLDGPGMRFRDGAVIHFGNPDRLNCLILYGETWRSAASDALVKLGLKRPWPAEPEGTTP